MGAVLRALAVAVGWLPWRWLAAPGTVLGWLAGSALRIRRGHVEEAMLRAGVADVPAKARGMYAGLGRSALELLWLRGPGATTDLHASIEPRSRPLWAQALAQGRGVVIASSHTGNWDLAACAIAREIELLVVTKRLKIRWLDRFWHATRRAHGVRRTGARGTLARAARVLERAGAVAMMIDQVPRLRRHAVDVVFLGRPAHADRAPATLAAFRRAPLVVAAGRRNERGEHLLCVLDVLAPPERPTRAWIDEATRAATRALETFVLAHPAEWLWLHRRWKRLDPGPPVGTLRPACTIPSSSQDAASRAA